MKEHLPEIQSHLHMTNKRTRIFEINTWTFQTRVKPQEVVYTENLMLPKFHTEVYNR
jgi:hypothetical protein